MAKAERNISFDEGLRRHLWKCELEYRVEHSKTGCCVDWLWPVCDDTEHIASFLRELGFKIREIVDEVDCAGDAQRWVETTSGIVVWVNSDILRGFVCKSARKRRNRYEG